MNDAIRLATEPHACVDGNGILWQGGSSTLTARDGSLDTLLEVPACRYCALACGRETVVLAGQVEHDGRVSSTGPVAIAEYSPHDEAPLRSREFETTAAVSRVFVLGDGAPVLLLRVTGQLYIDGESYGSLPVEEKMAYSGAALVYLTRELELDRVVMLSRLPAGIDRDGSIFTLGPRQTDTGIFDFLWSRYSPSGELEREAVIGVYDPGYRALVRDDGALLLAQRGEPEPAERSSHPLNRTKQYVHVLDRDGATLSRTWLHGIGDVSVSSIGFGPDGGVWAAGNFEEWLEVGGRAVFGHADGTDLSHQFLLSLADSGELRGLEAMGPHGVVGLPPRVFPVSSEAAYYFRSGNGLSLALGDGPAPVAPFLGRVEPRVPETTLPALATERLARVSDGVELPARSVLIGADGRAYVVHERDNDFVFVDFETGHESPPFHREAPADDVFDFTLAGDELFWHEAGSPPPALAMRASLKAYRRSAAGWTLSQELLSSERHELLPGRAKVVANDGWVFTCDGLTVRALRRVDGAWSRVQVPGGCYDLALVDDRLFVGNPAAQGNRSGSGRVRIFSLEGSEPALVYQLAASDEAPFDPGMGLQGDVNFGPPGGEGFGAAIATDGDTLLARNNLGKLYLFERDGAAWLERGQLEHRADAMAVHGNRILLADSSFCRGQVCPSGAVVALERTSGTWTPAERVMPSQRWVSRFGRRLAFVADDRALIAAPGYGPPDTELGAVFIHDLSKCELPDCWGRWICE